MITKFNMTIIAIISLVFCSQAIARHDQDLSTSLNSGSLNVSTQKSISNSNNKKTHKNNSQHQEQQAKAKLIALEASIPGAHFNSRHGPQTTLGQQKIRAKTGYTTDNKQYSPSHSGKWLRYRDLLYALDKAQQIHDRSGRNVIDIKFSIIIGHGYLKGGHKFFKSKKGRVIFRNSQPITAFPILK
jgi:hypothetical protein